jgi:hypothetical protein
MLSQTRMIKLLEPGTHCVVVLEPALPNGTPPGSEPPAAQPSPPTVAVVPLRNPLAASELSEPRDLPNALGGVAVTSGRIQISAPGEEPLDLTGPDRLVRWPRAGGKPAEEVEPDIAKRIASSERFIPPAAKLQMRNYEKEFLGDLTVVQSIGPVTRDRREGISALAVRTLGLIEDYPSVIPALKAEPRETRLAAIDEVRKWLAGGPGRETILRDELARVFRAEQIESIVRLLWGFQPEAFSNSDFSSLLIEKLSDDEIAIRELAFYQIYRATGRTYDYLPMAPLQERRTAIQRWEDYARRNGGVLVPP